MVQNYFQYVLKEKEREKRNKILLNSMRNKGDEKIPTLPGSLVQPSCPRLAKEIGSPNLVRKKEVAKEEIDVKKEEKQKIPPPNQIVIEGLVIEAKEIDAKDNIAQLTYENSETEDILTKEEVAAAAAGEMKEVNHLNPILMEDRNLAEDLVQNCVENALAVCELGPSWSDLSNADSLDFEPIEPIKMKDEETEKSAWRVSLFLNKFR